MRDNIRRNCAGNLRARVMHSAAGRLLLSFILVLFCLSSFTITAKAADPIDEIEHFIITVDVQEDASLLMTYHIDWEVLDDDAYGPLEWVEIGVPNSNHTDVTAVSDNIDHINDKGSSLEIYLTDSYSEGEVASFEFSFVQDHMYQIDRYVEGETVFAYTPAWFNEIEVKDLTIRWNADKAGAWQPDCLQENGYLVFSASLAAGDKYSITVAYPNDAFGFSPDRQQTSDDGDSDGGYSGDYDGEDSFSDTFYMIVGFIVILIFAASPIMFIVAFIRWLISLMGFGSDSGSDSEMQKKITRTKIVYYDSCPGCGAGRVEGKDECPY